MIGQIDLAGSFTLPGSAMILNRVVCRAMQLSKAASQRCSGERDKVVRSGFEVCGNIAEPGDQPW